MSYTYKYPRAVHAVDCVVMSWLNDQLNILLVSNRDNINWRLPGKILEIKEEPVENEDESNQAVGKGQKEGRQWGFKKGGIISRDEKKYYYPQESGYDNGSMHRQCVRDALRFTSSDIEFGFNSDTFIQLPVRDCPYRDHDRSIIEPNNEKYWWVISTPYLIFANPSWTGSRERQLSKNELDAIFSDRDLLLKDDKGRDIISRWVPLYQILYDNDIVIKEKVEPRAVVADVSEEKSDTDRKRPSEEVTTDVKEYRMLFDHPYIVEDALLELRRIGRRQPMGATFFRTITESRGFDIQFSLKQLNRLYELVFDKPLSLPNLKKTLLDRHLITKVRNESGDVAKSSEGTKTRRVELYSFDKAWYDYYTENQNLGLKI